MKKIKIAWNITSRDEDSFNLYLKDVSKIPLISPEEAAKLYQQLKTGDKDKARKRLIEGNLRFVITCAKHFQNQGLSLAELVAEGNYGLIKSANLFNPDKGVKFISYAVNWIEQAMMEALSCNSRTVRLPVSHLNERRKIFKAATKLEQRYGREASISEIGDEIDMNPTKVSRTMNNNAHCLSLEAPLCESSEDTSSLIDVTPNKDSESDDDLIKEDNKKILEAALNKLPPRSRSIIRMCFGLNEKPITLEEIGDYFGLTSERIRQLKDEAILNLKKYLKKEFLK